MAFSEPVRPVVTPCCISLVYNRHCPRHKKKFEKKWLAIQNFSTRSGGEVRDTHVLEWSGRPRISTKIHCDFHQKSVSGASDMPCQFCDTSSGSVTTAGTPQTFGDGMMIDTGRHTLDSCDFHSIIEREQCKSLTTVVMKSKVQHEKNHP